MDPFTGTGTFITRLLQSGLIAPEELEHKFRNEIHANEIVLLAYYIAAINIEAVYHGVSESEDYVPFEGICLTDTFEMYESDDLISHYMPDNSERRKRQKSLDINIIMGNPPYSAKQKSANDNAANISYPDLDGRIENTYAFDSEATNKNDLYNSYIRAFRWASDRIGEQGIVSFVTGAGWIEKSFADGLRKHFTDEFSDIYAFNLRGDIRRNMLTKGAAGEGGNVFGQGSTTGISISFLVKNPEHKGKARIRYFDVGKNLTTEQKLGALRAARTIGNLETDEFFQTIVPNERNDWINQGDSRFSGFYKMGDKSRGASDRAFLNYSLGVATGRDAWCYNFSAIKLRQNISGLVERYNAEVARYTTSSKSLAAKDFVNYDTERYSWNRNALNDLEKAKPYSYSPQYVIPAMYRPFTRTNLYFSGQLNAMTYQMRRLFGEGKAVNRVISVSGVAPRSGMFSTLMWNSVSDLQSMDNGQCFPMFLYEQQDEEPAGLFEEHSPGLQRRDAITDAGLAHFQTAYPGEKITKEDIFYYLYGLLHSPDYRDRYADNLTKELPRIPCVKSYGDFRAFSDAGRALGDLHVDYETVEPYPVTYKQGTPELWNIGDAEDFYRVTKMKFGGKRPKLDKTTVIYNANITMTDVPLEAYDYVVNGKPALEWVIERQVVKTDKASGIVNDANDYANETMNNPAYPLELFQRVITVSLETMRIVRALPKLDLL